MQLQDVNMTKDQVIEAAQKYMHFNYPELPVLMTRAKGQYVYDSDGNEYLDCFTGVAVMSCGNANDRVVKAVQQQIAEVTQNCNFFYNIPAALLAKTLCEAIGMDKIIYQNCGSDANDAMIKLARKYGVDKYGPHKYEIITALKGFHGRTYGALSATGQPGSALHKGFAPLLPGFTYAEYNNLDSFASAVTDNTIAIMVEPLQAEGGMILPEPGFLEGLRRLCDEKGLLLLLDEVQTGLGRTGHLMSYMEYGIQPDAVSMAKAIGNGVPLAAVCCTDEVIQAFSYGAHGTTYSGNALNTAAGYAAVTEIIERDLPANARKIGEYFRARLAALPHCSVRGKGLLIGLEFDKPVNGDIKKAAFENKLLVTTLGASVVRLVPALIFTEADCDKAVDILQKTIAQVYGE